MVVGNKELNADEQGFDAGDDQEDQSVGDIHEADLLVVDGCDPVLQMMEPAAMKRWIDRDLCLRRHGPLVWIP